MTSLNYKGKEGMLINRCSDMDFLENKLKPVLIPMQMGEIEPPPIEKYQAFDEGEDYEDEPEGGVEP